MAIVSMAFLRLFYLARHLSPRLALGVSPGPLTLMLLHRQPSHLVVLPVTCHSQLSNSRLATRNFVQCVHRKVTAAGARNRYSNHDSVGDDCRA